MDLDHRGHGWALGSRRCGTGRCLVVSRTLDGGRDWRAFPPTAIRVGTLADCTGRCGASRLRFAGTRDGYLYGPGLYVTTDGGLHWQQQPGPSIDAVAVDGRTLLRIVHWHTGCPGPCHQRIQWAVRGTNTWRTAYRFDGYGIAGELAVAPRGPAYALFGDNLASGALHQPTLLRSTDDGRSWQQLPDGCAEQQNGEAETIAASGRRVALLCFRHGHEHPTVRLSHDGGDTVGPARPVPLKGAGPLILTGRRLIVATSSITGNGRYDYQLAVSDDGGHHWRRAVRDRAPVLGSDQVALNASAGLVAWIGFPRRLWLSSDRGKTWGDEPASKVDGE